MIELEARFVPKVWGRTQLPEPFGTRHDEPVGEIWFPPPETMPQLLAKYIFAAEKLSIQLHPSDEQARETGVGPAGKEECWLIVSADEGATIAAGFREPLTGEAMRAAALDGSIERLMEWHAVAPGDLFYIPAGTVHAIGGGVGLVEIQQNTDITYRLYDYGRPRELHLDEAVPIAVGEPYDMARRIRVEEAGEQWLVDGPKFILLRYDGAPSAAALARFDGGPVMALPLDGTLGDGERSIAAGGCAVFADARAIVADGKGLIASPMR